MTTKTTPTSNVVPFKRTRTLAPGFQGASSAQIMHLARHFLVGLCCLAETVEQIQRAALRACEGELLPIGELVPSPDGEEHEALSDEALAQLIEGWIRAVSRVAPVSEVHACVQAIALSGEIASVLAQAERHTLAVAGGGGGEVPR